MKKAFTLIEVVVAVALLAVVFVFAGMIFRVGIESYRIAGANAEIMQKLRAITDQLNADFRGAISPPGGMIHFVYPVGYLDPNSISYIDNKFTYTAADMANIKGVRSDSIVFFATGDFQSTRQYAYAGSTSDKTVIGNVACIFYALANVPTYSLEEKPDPKKKILMRRQTIIIPDPNWVPLDINDLGEYCNAQSLADLIADFDANTLTDDKNLDPNNPDDVVNYMAKGVDDFTIQYVGTESPPDLSKNFNDWRPNNSDVIAGWAGEALIPIAFKFTFTLYDSKAIIKEGRKFTHIVYVGN
ncbi:MAG: prepilin-type N-terminal cleavage/methylation domain-containing protein [Phycisphaerae bacterium]|nr:prepilin-type N-terminal cleavage/methylation domain-containing protein [Phycisphaerae bacterium]MDD5381633.1 prepilin-type N-terminal cleavage/methylation domain-containing protein [Phycisphaerae bacterium]